MSRHRSPGGRHRNTTRPVAVDPVQVASRARSAPRHRAASAAHHGMGAAAAGGALAALAPALLVGTLDTADARTSLALTAGQDRAEAQLPPIRDAQGRRIVPSIAPVTVTGAPDVSPEPQQATVSSLIKAAGLEEAARAAQEAARCDVRLPRLGRVKPHVDDAARFVACLYDHREVLGVGGRGRVSDHPRGLAVDFMTRGEKGDRIARCLLKNQDELGVSYVIWKQRINYGDGWEPMEDRGSDTENHFDHVHVSFQPRPGSGDPDPTVCS
ncbi:hypothetical protein [Pseudonocardia thermophila]|uniref:hypothetical protein n=1 Tax=Pseudonocardia thermophila TaxID=1848 RepID=UPI00248DADF5|nr:hypothetical protein [Pseudonocardia thermophila]